MRFNLVLSSFIWRQ